MKSGGNQVEIGGNHWISWKSGGNHWISWKSAGNQVEIRKSPN